MEQLFLCIIIKIWFLLEQLTETTFQVGQQIEAVTFNVSALLIKSVQPKRLRLHQPGLLQSRWIPILRKTCFISEITAILFEWKRSKISWIIDNKFGPWYKQSFSEALNASETGRTLVVVLSFRTTVRCGK